MMIAKLITPFFKSSQINFPLRDLYRRGEKIVRAGTVQPTFFFQSKNILCQKKYRTIFLYVLFV
jgi:hypothetical protein